MARQCWQSCLLRRSAQAGSGTAHLVCLLTSRQQAACGWMVYILLRTLHGILPRTLHGLSPAGRSRRDSQHNSAAYNMQCAEGPHTSKEPALQLPLAPAWTSAGVCCLQCWLDSRLRATGLGPGICSCADCSAVEILETHLHALLHWQLVGVSCLFLPLFFCDAARTVCLCPGRYRNSCWHLLLSKRSCCMQHTPSKRYKSVVKNDRWCVVCMMRSCRRLPAPQSGPLLLLDSFLVFPGCWLACRVPTHQERSFLDVKQALSPRLASGNC
jgi:hypothetical protein